MIKTVVGVESGPDGNGGWQANLLSVRIAAESVTTSSPALAVGIVPQPDLALAGGIPNPEALASGSPVWRLVGAQVATDADLIAESTLSVFLSVYSNELQVGGAPAFGWDAAEGGTPAFDQFVATSLPANPSDNTAFGLNAVASGITVFPGDVLVLQLITSSSTVAWPGGVFTFNLT